jgi:hypothetical protein
MKTERRSPARSAAAAVPLAAAASSSSYGYKTEGYARGSSSSTETTAVKAEPRDIDMRKARQVESYSPTRPDYTPTTATVKTEGESRLICQFQVKKFLSNAELDLRYGNVS